jgi:Outer membrane protein beta-barrel domain
LLAFLLSGVLPAQTFSIGTKNGISHTDITGRFSYKNCNEAAQIRYNSVKIWDERWNISKFKKNSSGYWKQFLGFVMNCQLNKNISLQAEFNYEEKGFDFYHILYGGRVNGFYKMQYFTIPASFAYEIGKSVKYYGYGGMSLSLLLQASNYTSSASNSSNPIYYDESYRPTEFNKQEAETLAGLGIKIPLGDKVKFILDARCNFGITRAAKNTDYRYDPNFYTSDTPNNFQNVFNRSVSLCWGVIYKTSKKKDIQQQHSTD